jgi:4-amino-4-deoxy-L-arabinose transferase-like glycosyltransferase
MIVSSPTRIRLSDWIVLTVILLASVTLAVRCARSMSLTIDERGQMYLGERLLKAGGFEELTTWGTAPLPVLATATLPAVVAGPQTEPLIDDLGFLFRRRMFNLALFGVPSLVVLFFVLRSMSGLVAAASATSLLAFSPMFLAHSVIAATDVAALFFILLGTVTILRFARTPNWNNALLAAVAIGVAMAAKQTAVILFAVAAWALWATRARAIAAGASHRQTTATLLLRFAAIVVVAAAFTWCFYGFHVTTLAGDGPWRPHFSWVGAGWFGKTLAQIGRTWLFPASCVSFVVQMVHNHAGHDSFFLGEIRRFGTWKYWPIMTGLKATLPELLILAVLGVRLALAYRWRDLRTTIPALVVALLVFGCVSSNLNLGLRYLLPAAGPFFLAAFGGLDLAPSWFRRTLVIVGPLLAVGQFVTAVHASPHQLTFFNGLFVRPAAVHAIVADANLDWGQGLPTLAQPIARRQMKNVLLCTWGYLKPELYGIPCISWWDAPASEIAQAQWIALSAGLLHDRQCTLGQALDGLPPDDFGDLSMMIYSTDRPEVREALARALAARH